MSKVWFVATALMLSTAAAAQMPPPGPGWNGGPPPPGAGPGWHRGQAWEASAFWRGAPQNPNERIQFLQDRVNRSVADGSIDGHEGRRVIGELNGLRHWIRTMHWEDQGRLNPDQYGQVQARLDRISQQIHWMRQHSW